MKMSDIKVGMRLKSIYETDIFSPILVTEITEKGFKYTHEPKTIKTGYTNGIPTFGTVSSGEHYGVGDEAQYEEIKQDNFEI